MVGRIENYCGWRAAAGAVLLYGLTGLYCLLAAIDDPASVLCSDGLIIPMPADIQTSRTTPRERVKSLAPPRAVYDVTDADSDSVARRRVVRQHVRRLAVFGG